MTVKGGDLPITCDTRGIKAKGRGCGLSFTVSSHGMQSLSRLGAFIMKLVGPGRKFWARACLPLIDS